MADFNEVELIRLGNVESGATTHEGVYQRFLDTYKDQFQDIRRNLTSTTREDVRPQPFDPTEQVKIGSTVIDAPTSNIDVEEVRDNLEIPMLRSAGSALVKTGKGQIRISIEAVFPDADAINDQLRELIVQFRASPFLTIQNDFISSSIYGGARLSQKEDADPDSQVSPEKLRERAATEYTKIINDLKGFVTRKYPQASHPDLYGIYDYNLSLANDTVEQIVNKMTSYIAAKSEDLNPSSNAVVNYMLDSRTIMEYQDRADVLLRNWVSSVDSDNLGKDAPKVVTTVPVVFHSVLYNTIPEIPNGLAATIRFIYFNHSPLIPSFLYIDKDGSPVFDPSESGLYGEYLKRIPERPDIDPATGITRRSIFAGLVSRIEHQKHHIDFMYPTPSLVAKPVADLDEYGDVIVGDGPYEDNLNLIKQAGLSTKATQKGSFAPQIVKERFGDNNDGIIVESIGVSLANRIAVQPRSTSIYHSAQYMGGENTKIFIRLKVWGRNATEHDEALKRIHDMKRLTEISALQALAREYRDFRVFIDHELIRLAGVVHVQLNNVVTKTVDDEAYTSFVTLELVEFTTDQDSREQLLLRRNEQISLRDTVEYAVNELDAFFTKNPGKPGSNRRGVPVGQLRVYMADILYDEVLTDEVLEEWLFSVKGIRQARGLRSGQLVPRTTIDMVRHHFKRSLFRTNGLYLPVRDITRYDFPTTILISSHTLPKSLIDVMFDSVDLKLRARINKLYDYLVENDPNFRDKVREVNKANRNNTSVLYPDLPLPTYFDVLSWILPNYFDSTATDPVVDTDPNAWFGQLSDSDPEIAVIKSIVTQVMPTYQDLGIRPPITGRRSDIARKFSDYVDPDFFYLKGRSNALLESLSNEAFTSKGVEPKLDTTDYFKEQSKAIERDTEIRYEEQIKRREIAAEYRTPDKTIDFYEFRGKADTGEYRSVSLAPEDQVVSDIFSDTHQRALIDHAAASQREDKNRMLYAYPTFKLYFIEKDSEQWALFDDFYGYSAISNIRLVQEKYRPDLVEINLVNLTGNLDRNKFFTKNPGLDVPNAGDKKEPVTGEEEELDHFLLDVGTNIMLKMGYASVESELTTVFTGQIAELTVGDTIKLVAQSYKAELMVPINHNVSDSAEDAAPESIIREILTTSPTEHFGTPSTLQFLSALSGKNYIDGRFENTGRGDVRDDLTGARPSLSISEAQAKNAAKALITGSSGSPDLLIPSYASSDFLTDFLIDNPFYINSILDILPSSVNSLIDELALSLAPGGVRSLTRQEVVRKLIFKAFSASRKMGNVFLPEKQYQFIDTVDWQIPNIIGWQAIDELTRHYPGYVAQVLPYDDQATLFFGRPEQPYFYTDEKQDEEAVWQAVQKGVKDSISIDAPTKITDIANKAKAYADEQLSGAKLGDTSDNLSKLVRHYGEAQLRSLLAARLKDYVVVTDLQFFLEADLLTRNLVPAILGHSNYISILDQVVYKFKGREAMPAFPTFGTDVYGRKVVDKVNDGFNALGEAAEFQFSLNYRASVDRGIYEDARRELLRAINQLYYYTRENQEENPDVYSLTSRASALNELTLNPRMRPFRNYHFMDNNHIIANKIKPSKEFMGNEVVVNWAKDGSVNPDVLLRCSISKFLDPQDIRVRLITEINAKTLEQAWMCAFSNLAEALRPMYRGELYIRGNERIKPYDIVQVTDFYEGMFGPIEVERVVHEYSAETGYVTAITPQLVTVPNNALDASFYDWSGFWAGMKSLVGVAPSGDFVGWDAFGGITGKVPVGITSTLAAKGLARRFGTGVLLRALGAATGPVGIAITAGIDLALLVSSLSDSGLEALEEETGVGFWGNVYGEGQWGNRALPVHIVPLTRHGRPWVAGLKGLPSRSFKYKMDKRVRNFEKGVSALKSIISDVGNHLTNPGVK